MVRVAIDEFQKKKMLQANYREWLLMHRWTVVRYAHNNIGFAGWDEFVEKIYTEADSFISYLIMNQEEKWNNKQKINRIVARLENRRGGLHIIVGMKGRGKTYTAFFIANELAILGEKIWYFGPPCDLPSFITGTTMDFNKIPPNVTTIIDEASVQFYSRNSNKIDQADIMKRLAIIRHSGRNFIVITQNLKLQDVNFLRTVDSIWFCSDAVLQEETERARRPLKIYQDLRLFMPNIIGHVLVYDAVEILTMRIPMKSWWDERFSTSYRPFKNEAEKYRFIIKLLPDIDTLGISEQVSLKSNYIEEAEVEIISAICSNYDFSFLVNCPDEELISLIELGFDDTPINDLVNNNIRKIKGNFRMSPLEEKKLELDVEKMRIQNPKQLVFLKRNINTTFLEDSRDRFLLYTQNMILSIYGGTGTGKSLASLSISLTWSVICNGELRPSRHVWFSPAEINEHVSEAKRMETMILDEQEKGFGAGSGRIEEQLGLLERTLRERQINFIFTSPVIRSHVHHFILKTAGIDRQQHMIKLLVFTGDDKTLLGYITVAIPPTETIKEYKIKKDAFTQAVQDGTVSFGINKDAIAKSLTEYGPWLQAGNVTERVAAVGLYFREHKLREPTISEQHELSGLARLSLKV